MPARHAPSVMVGGSTMTICLSLRIGLAASASIALLPWFGVRPWPLVLVLLMLMCPAVIGWGLFDIRLPSARPSTRR